MKMYFIFDSDVDCTVTLVADDSAKSITLTVNDYTVLVYDDLRIYDGMYYCNYL
jgi:hypothetical protein